MWCKYERLLTGLHTKIRYRSTVNLCNNSKHDISIVYKPMAIFSQETFNN